MSIICGHFQLQSHIRLPHNINIKCNTTNKPFRIKLKAMINQFWRTSILNLQMKSYLNDFNIHGTSKPNPKLELQKFKNRSQKSTLRYKGDLRSAQESHNSVSTHPNAALKAKSKPTKRTQNTSQPTEAKTSNRHGRTHTDSQIDPYAEERPGSGFGKTLSRRHLKTQFGTYNGETVHVVKKQTKSVKIQDNFVTGLVKARLQLEKKHKKHEGDEIRKIADLVEEVRGRGNRNPEEGDDSKGSRRSVEHGFYGVQELLLQKKGHSEREEALCELVRALLNRLKREQGTDESQRLVRVVRQLQERNVRLMRLVNYMKGRGIDVDQYWNDSALS